MSKELENKDFMKKFFAGMFFIVGMLLMVIVILTLGKGNGLTEQKFKVSVLYRNVGGLLEGAPIRLAGVSVGNVDSIFFLDKEVKGRRVQVDMLIYKKYSKLFENNIKFFIQTEGILGEKLIEIKILDQGDPLDFSKPVLGEDALDAQALTEVFARAAESFTSASEDFNKVDVAELSAAVKETAEALSTTSKGLNRLLEEMDIITQKTRRILNRIEQKIIDDDLFKVF